MHFRFVDIAFMVIQQIYIGNNTSFMVGLLLASKDFTIDQTIKLFVT